MQDLVYQKWTIPRFCEDDVVNVDAWVYSLTLNELRLLSTPLDIPARRFLKRDELRALIAVKLTHILTDNI